VSFVGCFKSRHESKKANLRPAMLEKLNQRLLEGLIHLEVLFKENQYS
jgi:hypothetical protein